jgi:hypothetical protein
VLVLLLVVPATWFLELFGAVLVVYHWLGPFLAREWAGV